MEERDGITTRKPTNPSQSRGASQNSQRSSFSSHTFTADRLLVSFTIQHPPLQRRTLGYIRSHATDKSCA